MKSQPGKTRAVSHGFYIACRCGLLFIGEGFRKRYDEHSWECMTTLNAIATEPGTTIHEAISRAKEQLGDT